MENKLNIVGKLEDYNTLLNQFYFDRYLGKILDKKKIIYLEKKVEGLCEEYLHTEKNRDKLFYYCLDRLALAKSNRLLMRFYNVRDSLVAAGANLSLNWNQYREKQLELPLKIRREMVNQFTDKSRDLLQISLTRFEVIKKTFKEYDASPMVYFEFLEGTKISKFKSILENAKANFNSRNSIHSSGPISKILNSIEGSDDFYYKREKLLSLVNPEHEFQLVKLVKKLSSYAKFNYPLKIEYGKGINKSSLPFTALIRIPDQIVMYLPSPTDNFINLYGSMHELGHYLHFKSINKKATFMEKYCYSLSQIEFFPLILQNLLKNQTFLSDFLNIDKNDAASIKDILDSIDMMTLRYYYVNSLFSIYLYSIEKKRFSSDELSEEYGRLYEEAFGCKTYGAYWLFHHIQPLHLMGSCSIFLSIYSSGKFNLDIKKKFGEDWWKDQNSWDLIRKMMNKGSRLDMHKLS